MERNLFLQETVFPTSDIPPNMFLSTGNSVKMEEEVFINSNNKKALEKIIQTNLEVNLGLSGAIKPVKTNAFFTPAFSCGQESALVNF